MAHILIIDDNQSFRESTTDVLEAAGHPSPRTEQAAVSKWASSAGKG